MFVFYAGLMYAKYGGLTCYYEAYTRLFVVNAAKLRVTAIIVRTSRGRSMVGQSFRRRG